jgi:hypothetical protein
LIKPYLLDGSQNWVYRAKDWYESHRVEKEMQAKFKDFKTFYVNDQFQDIYTDMYYGYKRRDLVMMQRSLSDYMYDVSNLR